MEVRDNITLSLVTRSCKTQPLVGEESVLAADFPPFFGNQVIGLHVSVFPQTLRTK